MARPGTAYIYVYSRVRTESPGPGSYGHWLYYPVVPPSSNNGLLESSKRDMLRLFRLPGWFLLMTLAGSRRAGTLFLLVVGL